MNIYISVIEVILYYISAVFISTKILNAHCSQTRIILSIFGFIPLLSALMLNDKDSAFIIVELYLLIEIFITKFVLKELRLFRIIKTYLFIFFSNIMLSACADCIFAVEDNLNWQIELVVNILTSIGIWGFCLTKFTIKIQKILYLTSNFIKILMLVMLLICSILSVLIIKSSFFESYSKIHHLTKYLFVVLILIFSLIVPLIIIYSMTNKHMKSISQNYQQQIDAQAKFYVQLSKSNFELRRFKHDYKNMEIGLRKLISDGKNKEALEMLNNQNITLNSTSLRFDTGNGIVDALLAGKQQQADEINTIISFEGAVPNESIQPIDLCIIFGNPLDNAIEACANIADEYTKEIHLSCVCNSGFIFIEITNPVQQRVEIQGNFPKTTKSDSEVHGFGLYSLDQIIQKYDGEITCQCDDNTFKLAMDFSIPHHKN